MPGHFRSAWLRQFFHLCFISSAGIQVPWANGFRSKKSSTAKPQIIWHCKKYSFHCWNWKSCGFDLFFPDEHLVNVLSSSSIRSYSWSFLVETEISCVCVSCLTSRGVDDVGWCSLRGAIIRVHSNLWISCSPPNMGQICWPPGRGNLLLPGGASSQIGLCFRSGVLPRAITSIFRSCHAEGLTQEQFSLLKPHCVHGSMGCYDPRLRQNTCSSCLPPSWSFLQDALPSHFIFKTVYAANSDFSSRALSHLWVHCSQVSFLNTAVDKRSLSGHSITKTIIIFYKPWSTVVTQHLH